LSLAGFDAHRIEHVVQRLAAAHRREQQIIELLPEKPDVHSLRNDQTEIER
jgi:hypothetical protein